ncbi:MAG: hypothetical protein [Circular genetic element sp.]|nr:MAG: hypothetical protein [Circular genetic element sp.]
MAFKLKTGKTINKVLAGMGVATVASIALGAVAPQFAGTNIGRAVEGLAAYGVGGIESVAGAAAAMFLGQGTRAFTGPSAMVNVETESL